MKNALALLAVSVLLFSCGGEAEPEATEGVSTEVSESLKTEQEMNDEMNQLHDDLDDMLETL